MLKAGFSRVDVTPSLGTYLFGQFRERYAKTVLDPIQLNTLAFSDGETTALIIVADFIGIDRYYSDQILERVSERTGVPSNQIMVTSTHTHTSVGLRTSINHTVTDSAYMDMLYRKFCDVAQMAVEDMQEAELCFGIRKTAEQIAFIRRYYLKDGTAATNPFRREDEIDRPCEEADNNVRLLRFKRKDANDIALVNFCTHPDVVGGESISADWPGFVRRNMEKELEGVSCISLTGVQGDSNHIDFMHKIFIKSYEFSAYMGRMIADAAIALWDSAEPLTDEKVGGAYEVVFNKTRTDGEETYEEAVQFLADYRAGKFSHRHVTGAEIGNATRITKIRHSPIYQQIPVTVLRLGSLAFVGFGGEPFTHYAVGVQEACPEFTVISACLCNGCEGYLPTRQAFSEVGYEAGSAPFSPNLEEDCVATAVKLISKL